ncbi:MAG: MerR family transcriptional regulator [Vulcanimicrobiota bacterium]
MTRTHKIGDVAELLSTTIRAIRYYEEEGLLQPLRTEGGTRLYTKQHLARLRAILHLAGNGFSLDSIRLLAMARERCKTGDESQRRVSEQLDGKLAEIEERMGELQRLAQEIRKVKTLVAQCRGCRNKPTSKGCPTCPVKSHADRDALVSLIWDQES